MGSHLNKTMNAQTIVENTEKCCKFFGSNQNKTNAP